MKKKIINICKKNKFLRPIARKIVNIKKCLYFNYYTIFSKKEEKLIVFSAFMGRNYACSPKAIYKEFINNKEYSDYTFVWAFKDPSKKSSINDLDKSIVVKYNSIKYIKYIVKAKIIVDNSRLPSYVRIRSNQKFLQCWHGTPLKRLGYDMEIDGGNALNSLDEMKKKYRDDAKKISYLLSPSKFTTEKLSSAFNLKDNNKTAEIIEVGYPRNDLMLNFTEEDTKKIKKSLGIKTNKKIILYAPTWRDNQHTSGVGYTYDLGIDFDKLKSKLSKDYVILFRAHYFVANMFNFEKYKGFIYDVSNYDDITDLYIVSDMLITDYSSVFFDYANLKRPILFYMYDLESYRDNLRGFYLDLEELPGNIVEKESDLIIEIDKLNKDFKIDKKYKDFNKKFNYLDDGQASKRVVDRIMK